MYCTTPCAQSGTRTFSLGSATSSRLPSKRESVPSGEEYHSTPSSTGGAVSGSPFASASASGASSSGRGSARGLPPDSTEFSGSAGNAASSVRAYLRVRDTSSPSGASTPRTPSTPPP